MRKLLETALLAILCFAGIACSHEDSERSGILKVYNWADYIDEDLIGEFEQWYKEETGEDVRIIYQLFDINEVVLARIEKGKDDYDVICPSDYMIERMMRKDLLLPIPRDFGSTPDYIDSNVSPFIRGLMSKMDAHGKNPLDYCVGYMWGTTGFMYNTDKVAREDILTWNVLNNPKYAGQIYMKDAFRDVYLPILIYLRQDELNSGAISLDSLMYDSSDESIALVENYLKGVSPNIAGWEVDFGKEMMAKGNGAIDFTWSGDAGWAIEQASEAGVNLDFDIPDEGSNVWFDGWCIPKYARNVKAASYFINFMCKQENSVRNMDAIGYVSVVGGEQMLALQEDSLKYPETVDASYFFGPEADSVHLNHVQYPDMKKIAKCGTMHDSGERTDEMLAMWSRVKGDNVSYFTYIVIAVTVIVIAVALYMAVRTKKRRHSRRKKSSGRKQQFKL